jgi:tetrahydromethanopterin S-methyltransferase subunit G
MDTSQLATKQDLDDLYRRTEKMVIAVVHQVVGKVVGEIVGDALKLISERFDRLEARMDRLEDKLDRTAAIVDLHAVDIRALQRKAA